MNPPASSSLLDDLRSRTGSYHRQIEAVPFTRGLAAGEVSLESYAGMLRATAVVCAVLERELPGIAMPGAHPLWAEFLKRIPALERDLEVLRNKNIPDIPSAMAAAHTLAEKVRVRSEKTPVSLLGPLYVLEGSMKGAPVIRTLAARSFQLSGDEGLEYLGSGARAPANHWNEFVNGMNALVLSATERENIIDGAIECFQGMLSVFQTLHPLRSLRPAANPEAGTHAIPSDPRELAAAARAGERCWRQFPYLEKRYGERGWRFTTSDSAWLVTLAECEQAVVYQQVLWLGRVLATRGLPRVILESQLQLLYEELSSALPEHKERYEKLRLASEMLRTIRTECMDAAQFEALSHEFEISAGEDVVHLSNVGRLLQSAVIDEKDGITGAVEGISTWLTDPANFSPAWVNAVNAAIESGRQHAM